MSRSALFGRNAKLNKKLRPVLSNKQAEKVTIDMEDEKQRDNLNEPWFTNKHLIEELISNLKKLRLTLDMFFRICDGTMSKKITVKQFVDQIARLELTYTEQAAIDIFKVFDENSKDEITYAEFIDTCSAYRTELSLDLPQNYISASKRSLIKLVKKMDSKGIKPDYLFLINRSK